MSRNLDFASMIKLEKHKPLFMFPRLSILTYYKKNQGRIISLKKLV